MKNAVASGLLGILLFFAACDPCKECDEPVKKSIPPVITTMEPYSITATSAISGGVITYDGGSPVLKKGLIWSLDPNPDISLTTKASYVSDFTSFIHTIRNLTPATSYYVRAYAENAIGVGYGQVLQFTTLP
jgi:hypothetical protein